MPEASSYMNKKIPFCFSLLEEGVSPSPGLKDHRIIESHWTLARSLR